MIAAQVATEVNRSSSHLSVANYRYGCSAGLAYGEWIRDLQIHRLSPGGEHPEYPE
jgi:hypothetical protein